MTFVYDIFFKYISCVMVYNGFYNWSVRNYDTKQIHKQRHLVHYFFTSLCFLLCRFKLWKFIDWRLLMLKPGWKMLMILCRQNLCPVDIVVQLIRCSKNLGF